MKKYILKEEFNGFNSGTEFRCICSFGDQYINAAKLERIHNTTKKKKKINVTEEELDMFFERVNN